MAKKYGTVVTTAGSALITDCILNGGKVVAAYAAAGDGGGSYYAPTADQTALINECWRGDIAGAWINEKVSNMLDVKIVIPADIGYFMVREMALFSSDGTMIAVCNTPDTEKVAIDYGVTGKLTMIMHIVVADTSVVEFVVNSSLDTVSREDMETAIDAALANYANNVGSAIIRRITIPASGWKPVAENTEGIGDYKYTIDIELKEATEEHFPSVALDIGSLEIAADAEMCPTIQTLDGIVRFWAVTVPAADLTGTILLRSENLVDMDIATDEEVDDTVDDIFGDQGQLPSGYEVATDEEVKQAVKDIFGA